MGKGGHRGGGHHGGHHQASHSGFASRSSYHSYSSPHYRSHFPRNNNFYFFNSSTSSPSFHPTFTSAVPSQRTDNSKKNCSCCWVLLLCFFLAIFLFTVSCLEQIVMDPGETRKYYVNPLFSSSVDFVDDSLSVSIYSLFESPPLTTPEESSPIIHDENFSLGQGEYSDFIYYLNTGSVIDATLETKLTAGGGGGGGGLSLLMFKGRQAFDSWKKDQDQETWSTEKYAPSGSSTYLHSVLGSSDEVHLVVNNDYDNHQTLPASLRLDILPTQYKLQTYTPTCGAPVNPSSVSLSPSLSPSSQYVPCRFLPLSLPSLFTSHQHFYISAPSSPSSSSSSSFSSSSSDRTYQLTVQTHLRPGFWTPLSLLALLAVLALILPPLKSLPFLSSSCLFSCCSGWREGGREREIETEMGMEGERERGERASKTNPTSYSYSALSQTPDRIPHTSLSPPPSPSAPPLPSSYSLSSPSDSSSSYPYQSDPSPYPSPSPSLTLPQAQVLPAPSIASLYSLSHSPPTLSRPLPSAPPLPDHESYSL